ncbi:DUF3592 domain-containing protein [Massilia sp. TWP1-3-3]|uniref:DUF3592 domain-containing protein n=1 Tax=Massilia sp. TWP1-3-3 TaxID=2804573 RepID=UPI003CE7180C
MSEPALPRSVPFGVRIRLLNTISVGVALLLLVVGIMFLVVADSMADFKSVFYFTDSDPLTTAVLLSKTKSGASVGSRNNGYYLYDYKYAYTVGAVDHRSKSMAAYNDLNPGDHVTVAYVADKPELSRIQGMTAAPFVTGGIWLGGVLLGVTLAGLVMAYFAIKWIVKNIHLVRHGVLTTGSLVGKQITSTQYNGRYMFAFRFQFTHRDGRVFTASATTEKIELLEGANGAARLLYDPKDPAQSVMLNLLPARLQALVERQ